MSHYANIFNIQHFSLNDGPGIRTVVFFKGCPLNCMWCHNPESKSSTSELAYYSNRCTCCGKCADVCPQNAHSFLSDVHSINRQNCNLCGKCVENCNFQALEILGKQYTTDEIMYEIKKDDMFFTDGGGVTFSGGEPYMQYDVLYELLKKCKQIGYSTCIETSGYTSKDNIIKTSEFMDYFLYDCKEINVDNHIKYVGKSNKIILENLSVLDDVQANVILRCPVIPKINDYEKHFINIAELANKHSSIKSIEIMPYHPLGISKSEYIGKTSEFSDNTFLDREAANSYARIIQNHTKKSVKVNSVS